MSYSKVSVTNKPKSQIIIIETEKYSGFHLFFGSAKNIDSAVIETISLIFYRWNLLSIFRKGITILLPVLFILRPPTFHYQIWSHRSLLSRNKEVFLSSYLPHPSWHAIAIFNVFSSHISNRNFRNLNESSIVTI